MSERAREQLLTAARQQADDQECWERAQAVLRGGDLRRRLEGLGLEAAPELGLALVAAALTLAQGSPEFGGDYRDALADLAAVGLVLAEPTPD